MKGKPRFFSFVQKLATEEHRKSVQFAQLQDGRVGVFDEPDKKYVVRTAAIEKAQQLLNSGRIDVPDFLAMVTNTSNRKLAVDMASFHEVEIIDAEEAADAAEYPSQARNCIICNMRSRKVLLLPCNHMVLCTECFTPEMECPCCSLPTSGYNVF